MVMTGIEEGKIKINDPNSFENSNKLWDFDDISSQINNLWAMRVQKNFFLMPFDFMVDKLFFGAIIFADLEIRRRNIWTVVIIEVSLAMGRI